MALSEKERKRRESIEAGRQKTFDSLIKKSQGKESRPNPTYGLDPFEPSSYLTTVSSPALSQPLASGRYIDPLIPSGAAIARAADVTEFRQNPTKYMEQNSSQLNNEQSVIEKGATMLGRLFNYQDEADLTFFNVNLSSVESTWDGFIRAYTGAFDLLSIGFGGLISAAPGGVETLSYDQLSGGKTINEVLDGEMVPGSAPSPGQIALASVAVEAKRIREGNARLSDVLLMNPATAPFILAALAADTSPLQKDGFNIMDAEQRDAAFSSGYEQWMSGITDAGLMFADPLIGAGVALKVTRLGLLGRPGSVKLGQNMKGAVNGALDEMELATPGSSGRDSMEQIITSGERNVSEGTTGSIVSRIANDPTYQAPVPSDVLLPPQITTSVDDMNYKNVLAPFLHRLHEVDANGVRKMTYEKLVQDRSFRRLGNTPAVVSLLMKTRTPAESALAIEVMSGTAGALERMKVLSPGLSDMLFRYRRDHYQTISRTEPTKIRQVVSSFEAQIQDAQQSIRFEEEQIRKLSRGANATDDTQVYILTQEARNRVDIHTKNIAEATELRDVASGARTFDPLDARSEFHDPVFAAKIMDDLLSRQGLLDNDELIEAIADSGKVSLTFLPTNSNPYSRAVMASRDRRSTAAYQYGKEGTSWFPHAHTVIDASGKAIRVKDGWFTKSQFEGTNAFQRNMRVWRWIGEENPAGYIGLNGTSTVNSEREFGAAANIDLYRTKDGLTVTRNKIGPDGKPEFDLKEVNGVMMRTYRQETVTVGGSDRRDELFGRFFEGLTNPDVDSLVVLKEIEADIAYDLASAYGVDKASMVKLLDNANVNRGKDLEAIKSQAYFVDADDGAIQHIAYLESQLANGTYMLNFGELEKIIIKQMKIDGGAAMKRALDVPLHVAAGGYEMFNNFWRPATLLRLSYTQRNVFEGMIRAMAFSGSLAPLLWPIQASAFGIQNKVVKKTTTRNVKVAAKTIQDSEFNQYLQPHNQLIMERHYINSAMENTYIGDAEPMMYITRADSTIERVTRDEWLTIRNENTRDIEEAFSFIKNNVDKYDASIKNTAFGTWRTKNIKDLENQQASLAHMLEIYRNNMDDIFEGTGVRFDPDELENMAEVIRGSSAVTKQLSDLMYDPVQGMSMYRTQAGRQRRIGSGKSMGPDGNYHSDGFAGPLSQINANLMSSDNTFVQILSLASDAQSSLFFKTVLRPNQSIPYTPATIDLYANGLARTIEDASASWIVRSLVQNQWDETKVLAEMMGPGEGNRYLTVMSGAMGVGDMKTINQIADGAFLGPVSPDGTVAVAARTGIRPFAKTGRTAGGKEVTYVNDPNQAAVFISETSQMVQQQMMGRSEFMSILEQRIFDKTGKGLDDIDKTGFDKNRASATPLAQKVKDAILLIPEPQRAARGKDSVGVLGFVQGSEIVQMGADSVLGMYAKIVSKAFRALGSVPEDFVTRGGFYNMRYKASRNILLETYLDRTNQLGVIQRGKRSRTASNRDEGMSMEHGEFEIPAGELSRIEVQSHRAALKDTKEWMYTIDRRTNLGKYGEWIYPFISASQNSLTVAGKLLNKEPWLAPMIADMWRMPSRIGIEDEEGNLQMPMPFKRVSKFLADNPQIPFLGGVVDSEDMIKIPKNAVNMFIPETGFGMIPRPTPFVQVGASELMKANVFPIETPAAVRALLGDENADEYYQLFKDYIFGEESGLSARAMSWDKLFPAYSQRIINSGVLDRFGVKGALSQQYGTQYNMHFNTQEMRYFSGERDDPPTEDEINKRTTNSFLFYALGNIGLPTPLTPYPIISRPMVKTPIDGLQEMYRGLQAADPLTANMEMDRMVGDWGLAASLTNITVNVGGSAPSPKTVSDVNTLTPLISSLSQSVGMTNLSVLGILVNNRRGPDEYEASAYNWGKSQIIPGTNRQWAETASPEMAQTEKERILGWTIYRKGRDKIDALMYSAGLTSYELKAAAPYKAALERLKDNLFANPDVAGWIVDFQDQGGSKTLSAVRVIEGAVQDDTFRNLLVGSGKEKLFSIMQEYVSDRRLLLKVLEQSGHGIDHPSNAMWKMGWDAKRLSWRNADERWAEIDSLYLSGDDNPQAPGNLYLQQLATNEMRGVE